MPRGGSAVNAGPHWRFHFIEWHLGLCSSCSMVSMPSSF